MHIWKHIEFFFFFEKSILGFLCLSRLHIGLFLPSFVLWNLPVFEYMYMCFYAGYDALVIFFSYSQFFLLLTLFSWHVDYERETVNV